MGDLGRFLQLTSVFAETAGRRALRAGLVFYLTLGVISFVLFAGNGLDASAVTRLASHSTTLRATLAGAWITATLPVARALLGTRELAFVRALPVPSAWVITLLALTTCVAHAPWFALWSRGAGWAPAIGGTAVTLALQTAYLARRGSPLPLGLAAAAGAVWLAAPGSAFGLAAPGSPVWFAHPTAVVAPVALFAFLRALALSWTILGEPPSAGPHCVPARSRGLAIGSALAITLLRGHGPIFARIVGLALGACALAVLALGNGSVSELTAISRIALFLWVPACLFGASALAGPLIRIEDELHWLFELTATPRRVRNVAAASTLALPALGAGLVFGATIAIDRALPPRTGIWLALEVGTVGAAWTAIALAVARRALRGSGHDGARLIVWLAALYAASLALFWLPRAVAAMTALAAGAALTVFTSVTPRARSNRC